MNITSVDDGERAFAPIEPSSTASQASTSSESSSESSTIEATTSKLLNQEPASTEIPALSLESLSMSPTEDSIDDFLNELH